MLSWGVNRKGGSAPSSTDYAYAPIPSASQGETDPGGAEDFASFAGQYASGRRGGSYGSTEEEDAPYPAAVAGLPSKSHPLMQHMGRLLVAAFMAMLIVVGMGVAGGGFGQSPETLLLQSPAPSSARGGGRDSSGHRVGGSGGVTEEDSFDFIVVGSGPAGSVLSRRLVDRGFDVLLLEAGGPTQYDLGGGDFFAGPVTRFDVPLFWHASTQNFPEFKWQGFNIPYVVVGKGIGGSAVQDAMIYVRCTRQDVAGWNVSGWTWERVLQAYVAMEDFVPDVPGNVPAHHGTSGERSDISEGHDNGGDSEGPHANPMRRRAESTEDYVELLNSHFRIQTTRPGYVDGVAQRFVAAAVEFGLPLTMDFNDPNGGRVGAGFYSFNIRDGVRDSAAVRMLAPLLFKGGKRQGNTGILNDINSDPLSINGRTKAAYGGEIGNFLLLTNAEVTRVLFEDDVEDGELLYGAPASGPNGRSSNKGLGFGLGGILDAVGSASIEADGIKISASGSVSASGGGGGGMRGGGGGGGGIAGGGGGGDNESPEAEEEEEGEGWYPNRALHEAPPAKSHRAIGVEYVRNGAVRRVYLNSYANPVSTVEKHRTRSARGGIALTAGALMTPKILMNSGIGPAENLAPSGVATRVDSPQIGRNLKDHPAVGVVAYADPKVFLGASAFELGMNWGQYINSVLKARLGASFMPSTEFGVVGSPGVSAGAFLVSPYSTNGEPDVQLTVFPKVPTWTGAPVDFDHVDRDLIQVTIALLCAEGWNEVVLNASDPLGAVPVIRLPRGVSEYLTELDVSRIEWGVGQARGILSSAPLSIDMDTKELLPGPSLRSNSPELRKWIRSTAYIYSHWTGTARMGNDLQPCSEADDFARCDAASIAHSAVDPRLRLRGTSNVFVADASVMPRVPNGNVHSSVTMVAHRGADLLAAAEEQP